MSAEFEPVIPASEWLQTYALGRTATRNILLRDIVNYVLPITVAFFCKIE